MGTFIGHALPGAFFIIVSVWWTMHYVYTKIVLDNGLQLPRSPILSRINRAPIEGAMIVFGGMVGLLCEMIVPHAWILIDSEGNWRNQRQWQHETMYAYFALYGAVTVLGKTCMPSAVRYEKAFGALAYAVEGFLFYFHTHGRSALDVRLHTMLVVAIFTCFLATAGEVWRPQDNLLTLIRILFTMVQGTWFWHLGFVLFRPPSGVPWDQEDHLNLMFTTAFFTWHILIDMLLLLCISGVTTLVLRICGFRAVRYAQMSNGREELEVKPFGNKESTNHLLAGSDFD